MFTDLPPMKSISPLVFLGAVFVAGCGSEGSTPADDQKLRATFSQKEIDFKAVPPESRAMVLGQMRAHGQSKKADELEKQWGTKK